MDGKEIIVMKIRNLKTKVIGPVLLLIPMACMHLGDDHHTGSHHSAGTPRELYSSLTISRGTGGVMGQEWMTIYQSNDD